MTDTVALECLYEYLHDNDCTWLQPYRRLYLTCKHALEWRRPRGSLNAAVINCIPAERQIKYMSNSNGFLYDPLNIKSMMQIYHCSHFYLPSDGKYCMSFIYSNSRADQVHYYNNKKETECSFASINRNFDITTCKRITISEEKRNPVNICYDIRYY